MSLSSFHTRTFIVAGIGLALTVATAIALALMFRSGSTGLATHISSERTMAYIRTADRTELLRWTTRLGNLDEGPLAASVPEGDLYELAYLKKTSENGWVLFVHDRTRGTHQTLTSDTTASLLLPEERVNESLLQTSFFAQHVSPVHPEVVWLRPEALPVTDEAAAHVIQASLFGGTQILLLPQGGGQGKLIIDGKSARRGRRTSTVLKKLPDDLLWVSATNIGELATQFDAGLRVIDPDLATGLHGIVNSWVASKNMEEHPALWSNPLSATVRMSGSGIAVLAAGSLPRSSDVTTLHTLLAAEGAKGTVRSIELVENVRSDVTAEGTPSVEKIGDWVISDLGGSPELFFAARGAEFVVSTDVRALETVLHDSLERTSPSNGVVGISFNFDYLYGTFSSSIPFLGDPLKNTFLQLFGLGVTSLDLTAESLSPVIIFNWTLTQGTQL